MDKERAYNILHDLHSMLNTNAIEHFLFFGTLLGAYRNDDFLSEDIDIVCDYKDYWKVRKIIDNDLSWEYNCVWTKEIALFKYGRKIDILFADIEEENTYLYIYKPNKVTGKYHTEQRYIWKTKDIFPLQYMAVLNDLFLVPNNIPNCLVCYYGNTWNIPDPNWNRDRNPTPNLDIQYRQIAIKINNEKDKEYFEKNYDNDWIKCVDSELNIKEDLILFYNKLDFTYLYNLQPMIDILNESKDIKSVTVGEIHVPQKSTISRSLPNGHIYEIDKDNYKLYGTISLIKKYYNKTDKKAIIDINRLYRKKLS